MPSKLDRIRDEGLRTSLAEAQAALKSGDYATVVRLSSEAYAELLRRKPEVLQGQQRFRSIMFFPRLGAQLQLDQNDNPSIIYDREKFIFSEAVTYFEFALDSLIKQGL